MTPNDRRILKIALERYNTGLADVARALVMDYVRENPSDEEGWLSLSFVMDDPIKKMDCLQRVLALNPDNLEAKSDLEEITTFQTDQAKHISPFDEPVVKPALPADAIPLPIPEPIPPTKTPRPTPPSGRRSNLIWYLTGIISLCLIVFVGAGFILMNELAALQPTQDHPNPAPMNVTPTVVEFAPQWTSTHTPTLTSTPTMTHTPTISPTPSLPAPEPTQLANMKKVMMQVEDLRGLQLRQEIPMFVINPTTAESLLQQLLQESGYAQQLDAVKRKLVLLGFIKPTYDLAFYSTTRLSDNIAGFYVPEWTSLYVIGSHFGGMEKRVFSHEFDHALVYQNLISNEMRDGETNCAHDSQRCDAVTALIEGDAMLLMGQWWDQYSSQQDLVDVMSYTSPRPALAKDRHPPFAFYQVMFPYDVGMLFVDYLYKRGNWAEVNKAYQKPPVSTEQILHPEKYIAGETPIAVAPVILADTLDPNWKLETTDSLGEFLTYLLMAYGADYSAEVTENEAAIASTGWGGDTYQVYSRSDNGTAILVAHWIWDTNRDGSEFETQMKKHLQARFRGSTVSNSQGSCWAVNQQTSCLFTRGKHSVWIIAPDMKTVTSVFANVDVSS